MIGLLNNISNKIFNKQSLLFGIPFVLYFIFHRPIENFLSNKVVTLFLAQVSSGWPNDLIFGFLIVISILFYITKIRSYQASSNITISLVLVSVIYLYYRFIADVWIFTQFHLFPGLKYGDFLCFITFGNVVLVLRNNEKNQLPTNGDNSFFDDEPIGDDGIDELGYTPYAKSLASKIKVSYFNKAFAIGINGKWGLGKTSFIDLIKRELRDADLLEVNFNPWNSNSPKAIIQDFFETFQEKIRPYHSSLARQLTTYSSKLVELNDNNLSRTIQTAVAAYTGFDSLSKLFEEIDTSLQSIGKKIIVFIDDLDRLDKEEVIEVIRLIRNTANFHNTFFIVGYDRSYVINALEKHNPYNSEYFLEKIFQIEVTLPYFNKKVFRAKLHEKLKKSFPKEYYKDLEDEVMGTAMSRPVYLEDWLENMRDVSRLANALSLNLKGLLGEVDIGDFIRLELLRLKYPSVYEQLFQNADEFLEFKN